MEQVETLLAKPVEQVQVLLDKQVYKRITVGVVLAGVAAYLIYKRYK